MRLPGEPYRNVATGVPIGVEQETELPACEVGELPIDGSRFWTSATQERGLLGLEGQLSHWPASTTADGDGQLYAAKDQEAYGDAGKRFIGRAPAPAMSEDVGIDRYFTYVVTKTTKASGFPLQILDGTDV